MLAEQIIMEAEELTYNTCARCVVPLDKDNKVETKGWITYICKDCDNKVQPNEDDEDDGDGVDKEDEGSDEEVDESQVGVDEEKNEDE